MRVTHGPMIAKSEARCEGRQELVRCAAFSNQERLYLYPQYVLKSVLGSIVT